MSTVYVVQEMPGRDILSADKYGKLVPVMPPAYQVVLSPGPAVSKIKKVIKEYTDDDYILCLGDPSLIGIVCAHCAEMNRGKFNLLKWDKKHQKYYPIEVDLHRRT
tara:strand:+ start:367 stop:684 length:318 start_codon:yes stop_codon:yes gene_type:complete